MIAFGTAISDRRTYERLALPSIERAAEPDSAVIACAGRPIRQGYNALMDEAAVESDLEALILVHQDLELTDASLPGRVRRLFSDPRVGLAGALGVRDLTPHLWLSSKRLYGSVMSPGFRVHLSTGPQMVDAVDGALLVLAPWVVRGLRFGEAAAAPFHGYDVDISFRVLAHGGTVVCDDIPYFHHRVPKHDYEAQRVAGLELARQWDSHLRPCEWEPSFQL